MSTDTEKYRAQLDDMLRTITAELKEVGIHNPENSQDWIAVPEDLDAEEPDENLAADAVEEWDERRALVATLESQYNAIVSALARLDAGTFGKCTVCKAEIEPARLDANPVASTCIAHKEEVLNP